MGYNRNTPYNANRPPKDDIIKQAKKHNYVRGEHTSEKIRETKENRFAFMMNAYIDLAIGNIDSNGIAPSIFTIGHGPISDFTGMSTAAVFSYMNSKAIQISCAIEWAKKNVDSDDQDSKEAALRIASQYAAIFPKAAKKAGIEIEVKFT